jgi:dephospho-CoA kinase
MFKTNPFRNVKTPVVALTGGIASGKTTVACEFKKLGAVIIDTDKLSRTVCKRNSLVLNRIVRRFGKQILTGNKTLNRKKLARIIFKDRNKRRILESLVHPAIMEEVVKKMKLAASKKIVILDAPLLFETGLERFVNKTIVVWAPEHLQMQRLKERDGLSIKDISMRLSSQVPLSIKRKKADLVIDSSKGLPRVVEQIKRIWGVLTKTPK